MSEHWAALLVPLKPNTSFIDHHGVAVWALQFTPRVAYLEEAVVMELQACLRLFGGEKLLKARITEESRVQGVQTIGWAPTSLAALAFARGGVSDGFAGPLAGLLDGLALERVHVLDGKAGHAEHVQPRGDRHRLAPVGAATAPGQINFLDQ